jgi:thiol-disulfide isomerase/thioredoxin
MIRPVSISAILLIVFLLFLPGAALSQEEAALAEDKKIPRPAPAFSTSDLRGVLYDSAEHLGKVPMVLSFWSIYCDSCVDEMLSLQKLEDKYKGEHLVILAINEDLRVTEDRIRRFMERLTRFRGGVTYPILYDSGSKIFDAYGVEFLPTMVLVDGDGNIVETAMGYDPENEREFLASVERLVAGDDAEEAALEPAADNIQTLSVTGEATLCGFFDHNGWRKSFTGNDLIKPEMELTRDLSRRHATRSAIGEGLGILGIDLFANEVRSDCLDGTGIHLSRDPFDTDDPLANLINRLNYSDFFETLEEQEMMIDNVYYTSRSVRVNLDSFTEELISQGYALEPLSIEFAYVNMSRLDQKQFLLSLLSQSRFIGAYENPVFTSHSTSQVFTVYTSAQGFADEILEMDFGELSVFVEDVTPSSLELEVWK